jgi:outer membrane protein
MKRLAVLIIAICAVLCVSAQDSLSIRFGYLSYAQALRTMPGYALVQEKMAGLRQQYEAEMQRVTDEFNRKYEEFLEGQHEFPKTILQKRQTELQELMTRNVAFKEESRRQLADAEREALAPLKIRLAETVAKIANEHGLALVVNTDSDACPYINPAWGEDLNQIVTNALK